MGILKEPVSDEEFDWLEARFVENARIVAHDRGITSTDGDILRARRIIEKLRLIRDVRKVGGCAT